MTALSFVSDRPAPGMVDPRELTSSQLAALRVVATYRLSRVKGGWRCPGSPLVTLAMAQFLGSRRLVMRRLVAGRAALDITGGGRNTLAVADVRREARRQ
ncbi:MAG: hypothetical protein ABTQ31_17270 [Rhizobiaceae bacterium]